jgi:phosphatidylserine synthase
MRGGWDTVALLWFVACGITRLAIYNSTIDFQEKDGEFS